MDITRQLLSGLFLPVSNRALLEGPDHHTNVFIITDVDAGMFNVAVAVVWCKAQNIARHNDFITYDGPPLLLVTRSCMYRRWISAASPVGNELGKYLTQTVELC
jgi:hypothetical protein